MRRVLVTACAACLTQAVGCAHRPRAETPAAATAPAPASLVEISAASLPHGHVPPATRPAHLGKNEAIPGLVFDTNASPPKLSGVKDVYAAFNVELRDQADAASAFCVGPEHAQLFSTEERPVRSEPSRVLSFAIALQSPELEIRAERFAGGADARLDVLRAWATPSGGLQKTADASLPLRLVASLAGVAVYGFVDEAPPSVNFVIHRPPLRRGQARYHSFVERSAQGVMSAASCTHTRVGLPLERGNGDATQVDVAVETENGVRRMRIHLGALWLHEEPSARVTARMGWRGPEREVLVLQDADPAAEPHPPRARDDLRSRK